MNAIPRIGITTSFAHGEQRLDRRYVTAVERAGGHPVIVPATQSSATLYRVCEELHGLLIPGGPAVTAGLIGTLPDDLPDVDPVRTETDHRILSVMMASHKPILGVCYGMQLLNAAAGGTIYADVQAQIEGSLPHSDRRGGDIHPVAVSPGSTIEKLVGRGSSVNTSHIQAIATIGAGYRATAHAPDGVVEAIESEDGRVLGVQWHPERMGAAGEAIFRYLVAAAGPK